MMVGIRWLMTLTVLAASMTLVACDDGGGDPAPGVDAGLTSDAALEGDDGLMDAGTGTDSGDDGSIGTVACAGDDEDMVRPEGWTVESHCKGVDPDYDRLFDDAVVHRIDITIPADVHAATMDDLASILSGGGPPGAVDTEDPMWVPVTIQLGGLTWDHVGMRYKGNSSLRSAYSQGVRKLSFRLSFDKYEDEHPAIDNQRFYGFKKMTFSNGFKDASLIRDKLAADIFRSAGVPAARGAFARIYVDHGEGPVYFGLYTMVEDPSDDMLEAQFGDDSGNLYKPDGAAAAWTHFDEAHFEKKTNEDEADWGDIEAAMAALHADRDDAGAWRAAFEATFNADAFLRCLALNQVMVNWDSYGSMTHNYYVYGDPADGGRLVWFPWDLNESMLVPRATPGDGDPTSVWLDQTSDAWPLIRFLLDDPVYRALYRDALEAALDGPFALDAVQTKMRAYHALIAPFVSGAEGEFSPYSNLSSQAEFDGALTTTGDTPLLPHVEARHAAVRDALAE